MQEDINLTPISIDASVFISAIGVKDIFSPDSRSFFTCLSPRQPVILPILVVAETVVTLSRQKADSGNKAFTYLERFDIVHLDMPYLKKIISSSSGKKLKTSDFIIAATAKLYKATLITWDKQLLSSANTICKAITPKQFVATRNS